MKKLLSTLFVLFFAISVVAQTGLTCDDPIPVDSNYVGRVEGPCELWYTAYTYDLPLNVYFLPDAENSAYGPDVYVDFTCVPGVYEDPKIEELVTSVADFGYDLPLEFMCDPVVREGRNAYDLSISKFYRDQLTEFGINYNVKAFVRVTYHESGRISLRPDDLFRDCMKNSHYINLGDTLNIEANNSDAVFVAALPDWKNDSIRFVWDGTEPLRMFFATTECNFNPTPTNDYVYKYYDITAGAPLKMYSTQMNSDISNSKDGGIFYVKMLSPSSGRLIVEKIPMALPEGDAKLLEYDKPVDVVVNDPTIYAFRKNWRQATAFVGTQYFEMQISNNYQFDASASGSFVNEYASSMLNGAQTVGLTAAEMKAITDKAIDNYLYVRFIVTGETTITPRHWEISECVDKTLYLAPNTELYITSSTSSNVYRIAYADYQGYDMKIKWNGNARMTTYIGDTCIFSMSTSDSHVIYNKAFSRKGTSTVAADVVNSWANYADEDGYLFVRFNPSTSSRVSFLTEKPVALPPVYTTINDTLCFGEIYDFGGTTYAEGGTYEKTYPAANGADSVVTLNLTILPEVPVTVEEVTVNYNETYTWQGKEYTLTTNDTVTLKNQYGCDSVVVLQLTVLPKTLGACAQSALPINRGDLLTLNLDSAFTVYSVKFSAFAQAGASLTWTGAEPLHMFIAETCTFAVAPYNKYVHVYVPVPAQGEYSITPVAMAALAEFVDEDGYLYLRFLTEKEGVLTVE